MRRVRYGVTTVIQLLLAVQVVGCRRANMSRADTLHADTLRADTSRAHSGSAATHTQPASPWTVSESGAGVLRIGMTRDELARDLHETPPDRASADSGCTYLDIPGIPAGLRTMWVAGTLARIEVLTPALPTDRGARVGDSTARIDSLYGARATTMPAKYDPKGNYLVVRPPRGADSSRRLVFETDSSHHVTRYRAGREPEVEWVEGCG